LKEEPLTLEQRDQVVAMLERPAKEKKSPHEVTFDQIRKVLHLGGTIKFNLEDAKRSSLKGNSTSASLSKLSHFGSDWFTWTDRQQDAIVRQLVGQESTPKLVSRLMKFCCVDEATASRIAEAGLPKGYGSLGRKALMRILPALRAAVVTYDKAVLAAGLDHHSRLSSYGEVPGRTYDTGEKWINQQTGEIQAVHAFFELPYYGEFLTRHVGFGVPNEESLEKRFGKIPNPTVHIGLNQVRAVVNTLIKRYGPPSEVVVEVANELKRPSDHRPAEMRVGKISLATYRRYCPCAGCVHVRQSINQERNRELRDTAKKVLGALPGEYDMEKMRLWKEMQEMNGGLVQCPYSGEILSVERILSPAVEIDHILPHSKTLDDGLANKILCTREANRIKRERSPAEAQGDFLIQKGWKYEDILTRVSNLDRSKKFRFGDDAMQKWLGEHKTFLARALNDTRYLSRVAVQYLELICPLHTRAIPGRMTALLRGKFGLDDLLGLKGLKNRNDHRHHAVDACVIAVTDQGLLQRFAKASASAREQQLNRLVDNMPLPWPSYREHVQRAIERIWVSHKPDHSHEGAMFDATIYSAGGSSKSAAKDRTVLPFAPLLKESSAVGRHGYAANQPRPYFGLLPNSNHCIEIFRNDDNSWGNSVLSTFDAYQIVRAAGSMSDGIRKLRHPQLEQGGKPLVMRLMIGDPIAVKLDGATKILQVLKINSSGAITFVKPNEGNISGRYSAKLGAKKAQKAGEPFDQQALDDEFFQRSISAQSLKEFQARRVTISPIGELKDSGFHG
jgi:CRISPR-associated endonuclease Csn1